MPVRSPRPCNRHGCRRLCRDGTGFCLEHKPASGWYEYSKESRHKRGYGATWVRLRQAVFRRDKKLCQYCKAQGIITAATEIDHIIPKASGGTDEAVNLQALCSPCHKAKTQAESNASR